MNDYEREILLEPLPAGGNGESKHQLPVEVEPVGEKRERLPAALREIRGLLRGSSHLASFLTVAEREGHRSKLLATLIPPLKDRLAKVTPEQFRAEVEAKIDALPEAEDVKEAIDNCLRDVEKHAEENYKKARNAKPRNVERDAEIVRLRNVEEKTFGQIGKLLQAKNPAWVNSDGKSLQRDTVEKAYSRAKKRRPPEKRTG